eukprot:557854-Amorphochlora_amoeboformis.AAC.2
MVTSQHNVKDDPTTPHVSGFAMIAALRIRLPFAELRVVCFGSCVGQRADSATKETVGGNVNSKAEVHDLQGEIMSDN